MVLVASLGNQGNPDGLDDIDPKWLIPYRNGMAPFPMVRNTKRPLVDWKAYHTERPDLARRTSRS